MAEKYPEMNKVLLQSMDAFPTVLVIGVTENDIPVFNTNVPNYTFLQWLLNRTSLELLLHEKQASRQQAITEGTKEGSTEETEE